MKTNPAWITAPESLLAASAHAYRLRFSVAKERKINVNVTADERYILFLDGERIHHGPERGDGKNWFFDTLSLRLPVGNHVLVAQVWAIGAQAPLAQMSVAPGFFFREEDAISGALDTGVARWKVKGLPGYRFVDNGGRMPCYYAVGLDLEVDGSMLDWGFQKGLGSGWQPALRGEDPSPRIDFSGVPYPGHFLRKGSLPPMLQKRTRAGRVRHVDQSGPVELKEVIVPERHEPVEALHWQDLLQGSGVVTIKAQQNRRILIDLENYYCAYPMLQVSGGKAARVTVRWAEALFADVPESLVVNHTWGQKGNRNEIAGRFFCGSGDRFLPDGGRGRAFETLWWRAGRYVQIEVSTGDAPLRIESFQIRETRYPLEPASRFLSDEPRLESVYKLGLRALQMCSHETYMDCPYYEQLMYVGDTRLEVLTHFTLEADARLPRKAIELFDVSRDGTGLTTSRYPSSLRQVIPPFSLWWVNMVADYALWRGEADFIKARMPGVRSILENWLFQKTTEGLVVGPDGWNFVDWVPGWSSGYPPGGNVSAPLNWQLVLALDAAAGLERWCGDVDLARRYDRLAGEVAQAASTAFWDSARRLFADDLAHTHFSEHSQCLAVLSGRIRPAHRKAIARAVFASTELAPASLYFTHYVFEAYRTLELPDAWFDRLKPWFELESMGFKTTPETPGHTRSDCHAWGAHPIYHSYATLLGIRPASMGFESVRIAPFPCHLKSLKGTVPHPQGAIEVELSLDDRQMTAKVTLPGSLAGTFVWSGREKKLRAGSQELFFR